MATEDRFMTAFSSLVRRALDNDSTIDRRALYPAKVVKWETSGIFPSGTVDVVFNNDDAGELQYPVQGVKHISQGASSKARNQPAAEIHLSVVSGMASRSSLN
jgi:hypothetical protein